MGDLLMRVRRLVSQLEQEWPTICNDSAAILVCKAFSGSQIEKRLCQHFQSFNVGGESLHALETSFQSRKSVPQIVQTRSASPSDLPNFPSRSRFQATELPLSKKRKEPPNIIHKNPKRSKSKSHGQAFTNLNDKLQDADLSDELRDCLKSWKDKPSDILLNCEINLEDATTPYALLEKFTQQADQSAVKWRFFVLLFYACKVKICSKDLNSVDYEGTISANEAYFTERRRDLFLNNLAESNINMDTEIVKEKCQKWVKIGERYYEWQKRFGLGALISFPTCSKYWWESRANNEERKILADFYDAKIRENTPACWDDHAHVIWNFLTGHFGLHNLTADFVVGGRFNSHAEISPTDQRPPSEEQVSGRQDQTMTASREGEPGNNLVVDDEFVLLTQAAFATCSANDCGNSGSAYETNHVQSICNTPINIASIDDLWIEHHLETSEHAARTQYTWDSIYGSDLDMGIEGMIPV